MRCSRQLISTLLAVGTLAGCAAASNATTAPRPDPAAGTAIAAARAGSTGPPTWTRAPTLQLGLDIDFYTWPTINLASLAAADVAYVQSLHGNALSVSFPFFMHGWYANGVYGNSATPSPAELAVIATAAKQAGLYVSIRPILDESSLDHKGGRMHWAPTHPAEWFASYEQFLKPYAQLAEQEQIPEFITGAEFDRINNSPYWGKLDAYLRKYYKGTLAYSNNWDIPIKSRVNSAGVVQSLDAYPPMQLKPGASVSEITASWDSYLKSKARGVVLTEVGIASQDGAYTRPYKLSWAKEPLDPKIQSRWFTAACDAMAHEHDDGIYFWAIDIDQPFSTPPTTSNPTAFVDGSGASAIAACFTRLSSASS